MNPIPHDEIITKTKTCLTDAEDFLRELQTVPKLWREMRDAAGAISEIAYRYKAFDDQTKAIVAGAVGIGLVPLKQVLCDLEMPAGPVTSQHFIQLLAAITGAPEEGA